jgi:ABC-type transport system involved in multi-copper enzyme maturation permease subunit
MTPLLQFLVACPLLALVQVVAAVPWLALIDPRLMREQIRNRKQLLFILGGTVLVGAAMAVYLNANSDPDVLVGWGRVYGAVLGLQLMAGLFIGFFVVLLQFWPKGGAVALSTFREGVRQPMFWFLLLIGLFLLTWSPFLPYFTFGEDLKMLKDLGYITIMFAAALFGVLTASLSISEEIEGRTAVTVMSKPISRRNFLLGKFLGILLGAGLMTVLLGWWLVWIILFKQWWDPPIGAQPEADPTWVVQAAHFLVSSGPVTDLMRGLLLWVHNFGGVFAGLVISFGQVMILLAVAVSLATRLPTIVNALLCLGVYFLGHLTPVLTAISQDRYPLIRFVAGGFDTVLPALDQFDMGPAVVRYAPLPPAEFALYTLQVSLYAVLYTVVALLLGLILFEDRDVA